MAAIECESLQLNDGNHIPAVGLGTFQGVYTYEVLVFHIILSRLFIYHRYVYLLSTC